MDISFDIEMDFIRIKILLVIFAKKINLVRYLFNGWNTKADGSGQSYENKEKVKNITTDESITLYAQYINIDINEAIAFNIIINIIPFLLPYPPIFCIIIPIIITPNIGPDTHNIIK